ncbi:alpha/beta fold hydrolase [Qipengyuania thermophila]|uniref:alpha/beta fold hydrolase n=1 Tax=Qipengyuania thermophila TaxID=2509361 RepID=UPI0018F8AF0D|nr:alpha/beta hydrolase [Qipengyuania thermophila]
MNDTSDLPPAEFHRMTGDGRRVAYRRQEGRGPTLVFLPGYMSDMRGSKATALWRWAAEQGRACLLLDYSGCGESGGTFASGTLTRWSEEVQELVSVLAPGPLVLIGSSMGGWLMLLVAEALGARVTGLVGIAAAPDFTGWGYDAAEQGRLAAGHTVHQHNPYGPEPTPTHPAFWQDAQALRLLHRPVAITAPVRLIHGQRDADVPWEISLRLAEKLRSDDIQVTLVKDGDHRLSRAQDIALLLQVIAALPAGD